MQKFVITFAYLSAACAVPDSAFQAPGVSSSASRAATVKLQEDSQAVAELKEYAKKLNPAVGYFDPMDLTNGDFWDQGDVATVGWLRHSEIKHGRIAMAAFIGYIVGANGLHFPWKISGARTFAEIAAAPGGPPGQWDALPTAAKLQILLFIGFLEIWSEKSALLKLEGDDHYMKGGKPGKFPSFDEMVHSVPYDFYDPFKLNAKKTREQLDRHLLAEVNNGRLAMLGIMGFLSEQKVPGAVPFLKGLNLPVYEGQIMAPFAEPDRYLPFVGWMNEYSKDFLPEGFAAPLKDVMRDYPTGYMMPPTAEGLR